MGYRGLFVEHADELREIAVQVGADAPAIGSKSPFLRLIAGLVRHGNELKMGLREFSRDEVFDMLADAEIVLNSLHNLSEGTRHYSAEEGWILPNEDTTPVLATGAAMNWSYEIDGKPRDARAIWRTAHEAVPDGA